MKVRIRFDGARFPVRFVEVEDAETGKSISFGEWQQEANSSHWSLVFEVPDAPR